MRTLFDPTQRMQTRARFELIEPDQPALWGRLTAPKMLAHLCDQMRMTLGEQHTEPIPGAARLPVVRELFLYVLPWPKGKIQGPPEAFVTTSVGWTRDLATLNGLVERFVSQGPDGQWPDHPTFGRMSGRAWGVFCYRHFDHHLRQFGV